MEFVLETQENHICEVHFSEFDQQGVLCWNQWNAKCYSNNSNVIYNSEKMHVEMYG